MLLKTNIKTKRSTVRECVWVCLCVCVCYVVLPHIQALLMSLKQTGRHKINLSTHLHVFATFSHLSVKNSCVYFSLSIPTDRAHDTSSLEFPFNCGYSTNTLNNSLNIRLGWGEGSVAPLSFCNVLLHTGVHGLTGLMLSSNMLHTQILIERFNCTCTIKYAPWPNP